MSRKPHARLAHQTWRDPVIYDRFKKDWQCDRELYGIKREMTAWTPTHNEKNWHCIMVWRAVDAFGVRDLSVVPQSVRQAFEAILLADVAGETLALAYAYAQSAIDAGLVPASTLVTPADTRS